MADEDGIEKLKETAKYFEKFNDAVSIFSASISDCDLDLWLDIDGKKLVEPEQKLTKKQRRALAVQYAKKLFPKQLQAIYELELALEGLNEELQDKLAQFETWEQEIEDLNSRREELRDALNG